MINNHRMERKSRERPYLHETHRRLDINLHGDHGKKIYRRLCNNRANQRRELEHPFIAIRVPNDDEERGQF